MLDLQDEGAVILQNRT